MIRKMARKGQMQSKTVSVTLALALGVTAWGQTQGPLGYSVATPRPISPAEGTTTPSAQAAQRQNRTWEASRPRILVRGSSCR
jgi:hypothetical protein